jgi:hypothetical protein
MTDRPNHQADAADPAAEPWPDRLKASAALLSRASLALQDALRDERRFALLTNPVETSEQAVTEVRAFNHLLVTALTALIDLTAYENPEQEYPELEPWFEFKCPNVVYGRRTDTFRS